MKESNLLTGARTYESTQAPWLSRRRRPSRGGGETRVLARSGNVHIEASNLGVSWERVTEGARNPTRRGTRVSPCIGSPMPARGSFTRGSPAHAALSRKRGSSFFSPAARHHTSCSRSERNGAHPRGPVRERSLDGMALHLRVAQAAAEGTADRGDSLALEEDRRLAGVPACRNRVAEIGYRDRGSEKRTARLTPRVSIALGVGGSYTSR
jgi:hypothetical protein